jgi:hypothetical protein
MKEPNKYEIILMPVEEIEYFPAVSFKVLDILNRKTYAQT